MRFWDASAIVPLLVTEPATPWLQQLGRDDPAMLVWWGSAVECVSALARLERDGTLTARAMTAALERLGRLFMACHEIEPGDAVRETATRFLRVHPLRAADALQLAAAFRRGGATARVAGDRQPGRSAHESCRARRLCRAQRPAGRIRSGAAASGGNSV